MPRAIFDLDGTLVDQAGAARKWARRFAEAWGCDEQVADAIAAALTQRRPKGEVFPWIVQRFGFPVTPEAACDRYRVVPAARVVEQEDHGMIVAGKGLDTIAEGERIRVVHDA